MNERAAEFDSGSTTSRNSRFSQSFALFLLATGIGAAFAPNRIHLSWMLIALFGLTAALCLYEDLSRWNGQRKAAFILFALGVVHAVVPARFMIDWPVAALFIIGLLLLLFPSIERVLPFVESLEVGNTKLRLRELNQSVNKAEVEAEEASPKSDTASTSSTASRSFSLTSPSTPKAPTASGSNSSLLNIDFEAKILDLAAQDKYSALLRLGIEIEKQLAVIQQAHGSEIPRKGISWSATIRDLHAKGIISPTVEQALIEFRDVRNRVVHATREGPVSEQLASSAIDSGLRIYRLLKATPLPQLPVGRSDI